MARLIELTIDGFYDYIMQEEGEEKVLREENVSHPAHYTAGEIECIDAIQAALTPEEFRGFCKGNVMKYVWREQHKSGAEDLEKAMWYLEKLIEVKTDEHL